MHDIFRGASRLTVVAAIALVAVAIATFAWLSAGGVAGAATTGGSSASGQAQPAQDTARDGDCPEHGQGGSGRQAAPGGSPDTQL